MKTRTIPTTKAIFLAAILLFGSALSFTSWYAATELSSAELARFKAAAEYSHSQKGTGVLVIRRGEVITPPTA